MKKEVEVKRGIHVEYREIGKSNFAIVSMSDCFEVFKGYRGRWQYIGNSETYDHAFYHIVENMSQCIWETDEGLESKYAERMKWEKPKNETKT